MASIVSAGTTSATALNMSADTTGILQLASNNGTVALTVSTGQLIGIGTTSPNGSYKLTISGASSGVVGGLALIDTDAYSFSLYSASSALIFRDITNASERMRIDSSGNVGIGTTTPFTTLQVGARTGAGTTNPSTGSVLSVSKDGATGIDLGSNVNANAVTGAINWINYYGVGNYNTARIDNYADGQSNSGALRFWTASTSSTPTERMRIDSSGKVNINSTSNLGGILQVNGNIAPTALASSYWGIDFGTSTSAGSYVTLAYGATYDLAGGAGCIWIYEQTSSVGLAIINCAYGGTYIVSNPQNNYSSTVGTASKTNVYYNSGTGTYRIQNLSSSPTTYSYWIATMRIRNGS